MITQARDSLYTKMSQVFEEGVLLNPSGLTALKRESYERFKASGFPTSRSENWKYTQLSSVLKDDYQVVTSTEAQISLSKEQLDGFAIPNLDAYRVVFVNGVLCPEYSQYPDQEGVEVTGIMDAQGHPEFQKHFAEHADKSDNPFVALNTATFVSGLFVNIAKNVILDKPIHVVRIATNTEALLSQTRNLYVLGSFAQAELLESFVGLGCEAPNFQLGVTEVHTGVQSVFQHYLIQESEGQSRYLNHIEAVQEKHSVYNNYNVNFPGAEWVRNDINLRLNDRDMEGHLYGIVLSSGKQLIDNHTIVDHLMPHCESFEWYKTIAQGESTSVFNGKIFVREDAQKTNAFQQNNNILLGDKSTVLSKPQLEIFADDVKCSHGCTIGQFDDDALFYLRARGIGEDKARAMMVQAFAFDVTTRFDNEVIRKYVDQRIEANLE